jgi:hypothetical protein
MTSGRLIYCPYAGCSQTSKRPWNMRIHIKRKHGGRQSASASIDGSRSALNSVQSLSFLNHGKFTESSAYMYDVPYRQNKPIDDVEKIEKIQNQLMENIRRLSEVRRLLPEFTQHGTANSSLNEIVKLLMIQMVPNWNRKKENMPIKNDRLPVGFRISLCEKCLSGCHLRPVFYPIEFWALLKPIHECDSKALVLQNDKNVSNLTNQVEEKLVNYLEKIVFSKIGQKDVYLKIVDVRTQFFIEEIRSRWKLPPNTVPIEENDCTKIDICLIEEYGDHWSCRAIKERGKNDYIKITQEELKEFLRVTKSTFGVFQIDRNDPLKNGYLLLYLVL